MRDGGDEDYENKEKERDKQKYSKIMRYILSEI